MTPMQLPSGHSRRLGSNPAPVGAAALASASGVPMPTLDPRPVGLHRRPVVRRVLAAAPATNPAGAASLPPPALPPADAAAAVVADDADAGAVRTQPPVGIELALAHARGK